ncbi:MAG: hypothetical protein ABSA85_03340 [Terracidiphilus sp.]
MPTGLQRYKQAGDLHFATFSCYPRRAYLQSAAGRDMSRSALERVRQRRA